MIKVNSSTISEIGYNSASQILTVKFKSGATYEYLDVPQEIYEFVANAESVGKALNVEVKGIYEHRAI